MDYIGWGTLAVSAATLFKVFYDSKNKLKQLEIDRRLSIVVDERRRMQKDLFFHITSLVNIHFKTVKESVTTVEAREAFFNIQNHQINVLINLNIKNKHHFELMDYCDVMAEQLKGFYEDRNEESFNSYKLESEKPKVLIMHLINMYVREEEKLIHDMLGN